MKTVLITGANGQLGRCLQKLHKPDAETTFVFLSSKQLDISDFDSVQKYFKENSIDFCVNCAAYTNVELAESESEKAYLINAEAVKNLAVVAKENNATLIHISTDYVFNGKQKRPYTELDQTDPINVYGASKLKGEQYIRDISTKYFIIRTSWLYSEFGKNFFNTIFQKAKTEPELKITIEQTGTPTNANDLAEVILAIIKNESTIYGLYHFSNLGEATWYDFAEKIVANIAEPKSNLKKVDAFKTKAIRPKYSLLDKTKIQENLNIEILHWEKTLERIFLNVKT